MLNAGILASGYVLTKDGYEENFGVNYLSQFLLTKLLLPDLKKVKGSRIVGLSSHNHRESYEWGVSLTVEDINNQEKFHLYEAYSQSKLCMNLFMQELAERLSGDEVYPNAVNPGVVYTNILNPWFDANLGPLGLDFVSKIADAIIHLVAYSPEEAALSQVYLAVSPNVEKLNIRGKHFDPIATETDSHPHCKNKTLQKGLWEFSEKLTEKFQK